MRKEFHFNGKGLSGLGLLSIVLMLCLTIPSYSFVGSSAFKTEQREMIGINGSNNVQFAFGRYILVAPYAPSVEITDDSTVADLDNNQLFLIDGKKIGADPLVFNLGDCYYPTRIFFDEETQTVFIRATQIVEDENGNYSTYAVIKHLHMNLSDNGKPVFDTIAPTIRIPGVGTQYASDAPDDFVLSHGIFTFTNGGSIFTYSLKQGFLYKVDFLTPKEFNLASNAITSLGLDADSNVLSVVTSKKSLDAENVWQHSSELSFYKLEDNGTIDLLNRVAPESFPAGVSVPGGSSIAINWDGLIENSKIQNQGFAYFVGSDGVLYQTSWDRGTEVFGELESLGSFEELQQSSNVEYLNPVTTEYNKAARTFEFLRKGVISYIHRPVNAKKGGRLGTIHRPVNNNLTVEDSAYVLAQLGKRNKLVKQKAFVDEFVNQGGLLAPFSDEAGNRYLATYKGNVFAVNASTGVDNATVDLLGQVGNRLGSVVYFASRGVFVAVNSLDADEAGEVIVSPGALILAKRKEDNNFLSLLDLRKDFSLSKEIVGFGIGSIRRPCNIGIR
jgi:hypothetical protein